ncbi:helix-turn-helix transcriptional regulator [Enterobacter asburiae]|uniref:helix-turn-helix transcriptional regulator n=2 Tax=Enterobacter asburiae TaxID=61645 RepID=UPI00192ADB42|nr:helix-turn-helix transcriptional regulator [Enterobacter asburiae]MBL5912415.1 helix-turn-helix transcriptional regulator [Enterobacter asburiae]MBL5916924.1 helix-turn-helix transcriptional regulator [Enterobacter asburiae]
MKRFLIVSENQYLTSGLMSILNDTFSEITITRTNLEHFDEVCKFSFAEFYPFKPIILCESKFYNIARHKLSARRISIIEIPRSFESITNEILKIEKLPTKGIRKKLSPREYLLCQLFKSQKTDDQISLTLNISKKTISCHRRNIINKLNLKNKQQLYFFCDYFCDFFNGNTQNKFEKLSSKFCARK